MEPTLGMVTVKLGISTDEGGIGDVVSVTPARRAQLGRYATEVFVSSAIDDVDWGDTDDSIESWTEPGTN